MKRNGLRAASLAVAAALLAGSIAATPALAYFTDSTSAEGGIELGVTARTDIIEEYGNKTKRVKIVQLADSTVPVFVRAKVFANEKFITSISGSGWMAPDSEGWLYFEEELYPGEEETLRHETDELLVKLDFPTKRQVLDAEGNVIEEYDLIGNENLNVVVVYEATPIQFDDDGNMLSPADPAVDWHLKQE